MQKAVTKELGELLKELMKIDYLKEHYLVGGTNLAIKFNHRTSTDLDLFVNKNMELNTSNLLNKNLKETFGNRFESTSVTEVGVFGFVDGIKVDMVNFPFELANKLDVIDGARLASTLDIGAMKINAVAGRGSRKDFYDINFLLKEHKLVDILSNYQRMYKTDNMFHTIQALQYFGDAENTKDRDNQFISFTDTSWSQVKSNITNAYKQFNEDRIVKAAVSFHLKNDYQGKIRNIKAYYPNGALSKAFKKENGIVLTKEQLKVVENNVDRILENNNNLKR